LRDRGALELALSATGASTIAATGALQLSGTVGATSALTLTSGGETRLGSLSVGGALSLTSAGAVGQLEALAGSIAPVLKVGATTRIVAAGQAVTLAGEGNDFSGTVTVSGAAVSLRDTGALNVVVTASEASALIAGGALTVSGSVSGAGGLTLDAGGVTSLGAMRIDGSLTLNSLGAVSQTGALIAGSASIATTGQAITLTNVANDFIGQVSLSGGAVSLRDVNTLQADVGASASSSVGAGGALQISAIVTGNAAGLTLASAGAMTLGALNVAGNLTLTSAGPVTQSDASATVGGTTTILAAGQAVSLSYADNDFSGTVAVTGATVALADRSALQTTLVASGDVSLMAGVVQVAGSLTGPASDLVIVSNGATNLGALSVGGALRINSAGPVAQSAPLTLGGALTVEAAGQAVSLGHTANRIGGAASVAGGAVVLRDTSALQVELLASGVSSISSGAALQVTATVDGASSSLTLSSTGALTLGSLRLGGALTATSTGAVTQTAPLVVGGTSRITATGQPVSLIEPANDFTGAVSVVGSAVAIRDASAIEVALTTTGNATITAGGALAVSGSVGGTSALVANAGGAMSLGTLSVGGALSVTSPGAVSQIGTGVKVGATTTIVAIGQAVMLATATNDFVGAVSVTGGAAVLRDSNALTVALTASDTSSLTAGGALAVSGVVSGDGKGLSLVSGASTTIGTLAVPGVLDLRSVGAVTQLAAVSTNGITQPGSTLSVGGATTIHAPGQAVSLANASNNFGGPLSVTGGAVTLRNADALRVALTATRPSSIAAGGALRLDRAVTTGPVGLELISGATTTLGELNLGGTLALTSPGAVTQLESVSLKITGISTIIAEGQAVTLANATNDFVGAVTVRAATVSLRDANALTVVSATTGNTTLTANAALAVSTLAGAPANTGDWMLTSGAAFALGATTIGGALNLTSAGAVTQTGVVKVGTTTRIVAKGPVTLANPGNDFVGPVAVSGVAVSLRDANALDLSISATGNSVITAGTTLKLAGSVTGTGMRLTTTSGGATTLGALNVSGALSVTSGGAVTQSGAAESEASGPQSAAAATGLQVGGATIIRAVAGKTPVAVTLTDETNNFIGALNVSGSAVALRDANTLTATVTATETSTVTAGGALTVAGAVSGVGKDLSLNSGATTVLGTLAVGGSLSLTSAGAVTQTGTGVRVGGASTITAGQNAVVMGTATNDFAGRVTVTGGAITLRDMSALSVTLAASDTSSVSAGAALVDVTGTVSGAGKGLTLSAITGISLGTLTIGGALTLTSMGAVTQTGALLTGAASRITALGKSVTLDHTGNDFGGGITVSSAASKLVSGSALDVSLNVTGATQVQTAGLLTIAGTAVGATHTLTLDSAGLRFGSLTVGGNLTVTSSGSVTQTGPLRVDKTFTLSAPNGDDDLKNPDNKFTVVEIPLVTSQSTNVPYAVEQVPVSDHDPVMTAAVEQDVPVAVALTGALALLSGRLLKGRGNREGIPRGNSVPIELPTENYAGGLPAAQSAVLILSSMRGSADFMAVSDEGLLLDASAGSLVLIEPAQGYYDDALASPVDSLARQVAGVHAAGRSILLRSGYVTVSGSASALVGRPATSESGVTFPNPRADAFDSAQCVPDSQSAPSARIARGDPTATSPGPASVGSGESPPPLKSGPRGLALPLNRLRSLMLGGLGKIGRIVSGRDVNE
jgi:hypothetical protein